jgi:hypothetical protein
MTTERNLQQIEQQAWRKYLSACWAGATEPERQWAFDRWLTAEHQLNQHLKTEQAKQDARRAKARTDQLPAIKRPVLKR